MFKCSHFPCFVISITYYSHAFVITDVFSDKLNTTIYSLEFRRKVARNSGVGVALLQYQNMTVA